MNNNYYIVHSSKGSTWSKKNHKYIKKEVKNGKTRYYYKDGRSSKDVSDFWDDGRIFDENYDELYSEQYANLSYVDTDGYGIKYKAGFEKDSNGDVIYARRLKQVKKGESWLTKRSAVYGDDAAKIINAITREPKSGLVTAEYAEHQVYVDKNAKYRAARVDVVEVGKIRQYYESGKKFVGNLINKGKNLFKKKKKKK